MKKLIVTLSIALMFSFAFGVKAMSESDLFKKLSASYDINGQVYKISDGDKVLAKKYLDTYEVSAKDADYISGKIDEVVSAMRKSGVTDFTNFSKYPSSLKNTLKGLVQDVASNTKVKATVKKGNVVIYNPDGTVFAEVNHLVKNTGSSVNVVAAVALVVAAVGSIILIKNVKENA